MYMFEVLPQTLLRKLYRLQQSSNPDLPHDDNYLTDKNVYSILNLHILNLPHDDNSVKLWIMAA